MIHGELSKRMCPGFEWKKWPNQNVENENSSPKTRLYCLKNILLKTNFLEAAIWGNPAIRHVLHNVLADDWKSISAFSGTLCKVASGGRRAARRRRRRRRQAAASSGSIRTACPRRAWSRCTPNTAGSSTTFDWWSASPPSSSASSASKATCASDPPPSEPSSGAQSSLFFWEKNKILKTFYIFFPRKLKTWNMVFLSFLFFSLGKEMTAFTD